MKTQNLNYFSMPLEAQPSDYRRPLYSDGQPSNTTKMPPPTPLSHHLQTPWRDETTTKNPELSWMVTQTVRREPRCPTASTTGDHANQTAHHHNNHLAIRPRSGQPNKKPYGRTNEEGRKIESRGTERETVEREKAQRSKV